MSELEAHTSALVMEPMDSGSPRVLVLVGHFGDDFCSRFAEDPEGQPVGEKGKQLWEENSSGDVEDGFGGGKKLNAGKPVGKQLPYLPSLPFPPKKSRWWPEQGAAVRRTSRSQLIGVRVVE